MTSPLRVPGFRDEFGNAIKTIQLNTCFRQRMINSTAMLHALVRIQDVNKTNTDAKYHFSVLGTTFKSLQNKRGKVRQELNIRIFCHLDNIFSFRGIRSTLHTHILNVFGCLLYTNVLTFECSNCRLLVNDSCNTELTNVIIFQPSEPTINMSISRISTTHNYMIMKKSQI